MSARDIALAAAAAALDKKGLEPVLIDVRGAATYTDYLLLVSGSSERQVGAVADTVEQRLAAHGVPALGVEGRGTGWVLLDYGQVVVHVFCHPLREFYDLEGLWVDSPRVRLEVPPESRLNAADAY